MSQEFTDKVVIVTGAGSGIGRATAVAFAEEGAQVVVVDLSADAATDTCDFILQSGGKAMRLVADVADSGDCRMVARETTEAFGRIDVLFNNAGITVRKDSLETTEDEWDKVIAVNLTSVFRMSRSVLPHMIERKSGCIINTASGWGINGGARAVSYCASKGGVVLLTKAMAIDHGPQGIRVNCICPGDTSTQMLVSEALQLGLPADQLIKEGKHRPLGRVGHPQDIANGVLFLASEKSSFITGTPLIVDGGGLAGSA